MIGKKNALEHGTKDGRPKKYDEKNIQRAIELLQSKTYEEVSEITGIPYGTLRYYKRKAKEQQEESK